MIIKGPHKGYAKLDLGSILGFDVVSLDPNTYQLRTIYKMAANRTDPTGVKGAQNKGP